MGDEFKDVGVGKPIVTFSIPAIDGESDWFKPIESAASGTRIEPMTLSVEATSVAPETLGLFFGENRQDPETGYITTAIWMEHTDTVSGAPPYPKLPVLDQPWWQWRKRREVIQLREDLMRAWEISYAAWVRDGRPDREVLVRTYIPSARIVTGD